MLGIDVRRSAVPVDIEVTGRVQDVRDIDGFEPELIFHLASPVGVPTTTVRPAETYRSIVEMADRVCAWSRSSGAGVINVSSSEIYGEALCRINSATTPSPRSPYADAKLDAEQRIKAGAARSVHPRPFNVFGDGQRGEFLVPMVITHLRAGWPVPVVDGGRPTRQFLHVAEFVEACVRVLQCEPWSKTLNLAGPGVLSVRAVVATIARLLNVTAVVEPVEPEEVGRLSTTECRHRCVAHREIEETLGWAPTTTFSDGIRADLTVEVGDEMGGEVVHVVGRAVDETRLSAAQEAHPSRYMPGDSTTPPS